MKRLILFLFLAVCLMLSGCADGVSLEQAIEMQATDPAGFWSGLWHGMILPWAFIGQLFSDNIAIYAIYNNGGWYDFGFCLGAGAIISACSC